MSRLLLLPTLTLAVPVARVMTCEALPAMRPPLPATLLAWLRSFPVALKTTSPIVTSLLAWVLLPRLATVWVVAVALATATPTDKPPLTAMPKASAYWWVALSALMSMRPPGSCSRLPVVALTEPLLLAVATVPLALKYRPPLPAMALATMFAVPGSLPASIFRSAARVRPLLPSSELSSPKAAVTRVSPLAVATEAPTPTAPPRAAPMALADTFGKALADKVTPPLPALKVTKLPLVLVTVLLSLAVTTTALPAPNKPPAAPLPLALLLPRSLLLRETVCALRLALSSTFKLTSLCARQPQQRHRHPLHRRWRRWQWPRPRGCPTGHL